MKNHFTVCQKLPSLNDYTNACRSHAQKGGTFKREIEEFVSWYIIQAKTAKTLRPTKNPVVVHFTWHESTKRRDADNIASAKKFILDALQKCGIIPNDNRKYVKGFHDTIIDDREDFVEVEIIEI